MVMKKVAQKTRALLQREISSTCPFCNNEDVDQFQVHHIDENPENNNPRNLLMLCPNCHSKITKHDISRAEVIMKKSLLVSSRSNSEKQQQQQNICDQYIKIHLILLLRDQYELGEESGGWGLSNSVFFALTNPAKEVVNRASITQSFWAVQALEILRSKNFQSSPLLNAEHKAQEYITNQVDRWQKSEKLSPSIATGRHIATTLLSAQKLNPHLEGDDLLKLKRRIAPYRILAKLIEMFPELTEKELNKSIRNVTAGAYMLRALVQSLNELDSLFSKRIDQKTRSIWALEHLESLSKNILVNYALRVLNSINLKENTNLEDCFNPNLQLLLSLIILSPSKNWWPGNWPGNEEIFNLYKTKLSQILNYFLDTINKSLLIPIHPQGPGDITTTYALGLCALEGINLELQISENLVAEILELTRKHFLFEDLSSLSTTLTWSLGILFELSVGNEFKFRPDDIETQLSKLSMPKHGEIVDVLEKTSIDLDGQSRVYLNKKVYYQQSVEHRVTNVLLNLDKLAVSDPNTIDWTYSLKENIKNKYNEIELLFGFGRAAIIVAGPSCSGKSTLIKELNKFNFMSVVNRFQTSYPLGQDRKREIEIEFSEIIEEDIFLSMESTRRFFYVYDIDGIKYGSDNNSFSEILKEGKIAIFSSGGHYDNIIRFSDTLLKNNVAVFICVLTTEQATLEKRMIKRYENSEKVYAHLREAERFYKKIIHLPVPYETIDTNLKIIENITAFLSKIPEKILTYKLLRA